MQEGKVTRVNLPQRRETFKFPLSPRWQVARRVSEEVAPLEVAPFEEQKVYANPVNGFSTGLRGVGPHLRGGLSSLTRGAS